MTESFLIKTETLNRPGSAPGASTAASMKHNSSELSDYGLDPELSFGITFRRIGAGLKNLGNTCFLNSVLQCLTYTEPLVAYLQSGKHKNSCHIAGFCALCAIQDHVSRALQSTGTILSPADLVRNLRCISRNFRTARQEDAHEYMVNLLESMHKCCLPSGVPSESPGAYEKSFVHKIFGGSLRSQVKWQQCSYGSNKFDPFLDLSLDIFKADSLEKALSNFTAAEWLDGGERQYHCKRCKQKVRALKQLTIHKAPYVLTIHLKRFHAPDPGQKIKKNVQFGCELNLKPFVSGSYDGDVKYSLYGVLVHSSSSTHSGHYYCYVRTSNNMWYTLDDSQVSHVSEREVLNQQAYMLFYVCDRKSIIPRKPVDIVKKDNMKANVNGNRDSSTSNHILIEVPNGIVENKLCGEPSMTTEAEKNMSNVDSSRVSFLNDALVQKKYSVILAENLMLGKIPVAELSPKALQPVDSPEGLSATKPELECMSSLDHSKKDYSVPSNLQSSVAPSGCKIDMSIGDVVHSRKLVSYKDMVLQLNGDNTLGDSEVVDDMEEEQYGLQEEELPIHQENPLCPVYHLSKSQHIEDCKKWRKALIIKLLGKRLNNRLLMTRLLKIWNLSGTFEVIDLDNGYILINFKDDKDYQHVLQEGPWIVMEHYVVVQRWRPMFDPYDEQVKRMAVWVRIPGLPIELYSSFHLWKIGNLLGKTIKVDKNSLRKSDSEGGEYTEKAKYARICIEVDLRKSFISQFHVLGRTFNVAYEGLHLICFGCGRYGHRKDMCSGGVDSGEKQKPTPTATTSMSSILKTKDTTCETTAEAFSSWMVVHKHPRRSKPKVTPQNQAEAHGKSQPQKIGNGQVRGWKVANVRTEASSASRFTVLSGEEQEDTYKGQTSVQQEDQKVQEEQVAKVCQESVPKELTTCNKPKDLIGIQYSSEKTKREKGHSSSDISITKLGIIINTHTKHSRPSPMGSRIKEKGAQALEGMHAEGSRKENGKTHIKAETYQPQPCKDPGNYCRDQELKTPMRLMSAEQNEDGLMNSISVIRLNNTEEPDTKAIPPCVVEGSFPTATCVVFQAKEDQPVLNSFGTGGKEPESLNQRSRVRALGMKKKDLGELPRKGSNSARWGLVFGCGWRIPLNLFKIKNKKGRSPWQE